jgi:hypothetical protein
VFIAFFFLGGKDGAIVQQLENVPLPLTPAQDLELTVIGPARVLTSERLENALL